METKERSRTRIGFSRMEKKYEWKDHVIFMGILLATAVWVNRNIEIKGLYMDDLYFWSCYGEQGFLQYVFLWEAPGSVSFTIWLPGLRWRWWVIM